MTRRFYCGMNEIKPRGVVQVERPLTDRRTDLGKTTLPEEVLKLAHEEYALHHNQSFEQIQLRGGFGVLEVIALLSDHVNRLKASSQKEGEA